MEKLNEIDRRVLETMSGPERIRLLLRNAGFATLRAFADKIGRSQQEVSFCVTGERPYPEIRDALALHLDLRRSEVDAIIKGAKAEPAEVPATDPAA